MLKQLSNLLCRLVTRKRLLFIASLLFSTTACNAHEVDTRELAKAERPSDVEADDVEWLLDRVFGDQKEIRAPEIGILNRLRFLPLVDVRPIDTRHVAGSFSLDEPSVWNTFPDIVVTNEGWIGGNSAPLVVNGNGWMETSRVLAEIEGTFVANPTRSLMASSTLNFFIVNPANLQRYKSIFASYMDPNGISPTFIETGEGCTYFKTYTSSGRWSEMTVLYADENGAFSTYDSKDLSCFLSVIAANTGFSSPPSLEDYQPHPVASVEKRCGPPNQLLPSTVISGQTYDAQSFFCFRLAKRLYAVLAYVEAISSKSAEDTITRAALRAEINEILTRDNRWQLQMKRINDGIRYGIDPPEEVPIKISN